MINSINRKILDIIHDNARISNAELARQLGLAPSGVLERMKKLESSGLIMSYETRVNPKKAGLELTAFVQVETNEKIGSTDVGRKLARLPGVQEVHMVAGQYCYYLKTRVANTDAHNGLLKKMGSIAGVKNAQTTLVLETIKESLDLDF